MRHLNKHYPYQKQLKNRSSKHLHWLVGPGTKPAWLSWSTEALKEASKRLNVKGNVFDAEINRREKRAQRRAKNKESNAQ